jgi:hypothetical protein
MRNILNLITLVVLVGCAAQSAATFEATPTDEPTLALTDAPTELPQLLPTSTGTQPVQPLVTVQRHGGLCVAGACQSTMSIYENGSISYDYVGQEEVVGDGGALSDDALNELHELIAQTDFKAIKSVPFTDMCPTAYDGQEVIYVVTDADGVEQRLASCEVVIDPSLPVFAWLDALWARITAPPS